MGEIRQKAAEIFNRGRKTAAAFLFLDCMKDAFERTVCKSLIMDSDTKCDNQGNSGCCPVFFQLFCSEKLGFSKKAEIISAFFGNDKK